MPTLQNNTIRFSFPQIHPNANCEITLKRTLRVPDIKGKTFNLPPDMGNFPIEHTKTYEKNLDTKTNERSGVMVPMYQSEALWINFNSDYVAKKNVKYPFAIKIAAGKKSAVTGKEWDNKQLVAKDYVIIPNQRWLDGFMSESGIVKQFVALPLGLGFTVEEQLSGEAEFGGIQIEVYAMKLDFFEKTFPDYVEPERPKYRARSGATGQSSGHALESMTLMRSCSTNYKKSSPSLGLAGGGQIEQQIIEDSYGLDAWSSEKDRVFIHLFNSMSWQSITGKMPPTVPFDAKTYANAGMKWFDYYDENAKNLSSTFETERIKSVAELEQETGISVLPTNDDFDIKKENVKDLSPKIKSNPNEIKNGNW